MRKSLLFLIAAQFLGIGRGMAPQADAQSRPKPVATAQIKWLSDPKLAIEEAQKRQRPLVLYVTSESCVFCRKMERETWTDADVVKSVNQNFVALKLDGEKHVQIVTKLEIKGFPATILFDRDGTAADSLEGFVDRQELQKILKSHSPDVTAQK